MSDQQNQNPYPRGSEWRKWDLHVHTPASFHWNGGNKFLSSNNQERTHLMNNFLNAINSSEISVYCIMDYWTFDWCIELIKMLKSQPDRLQKTVLYGMELRVESPTDYRLNIHVILSDHLSEQNLNDFKSELKIRIGSTLKNLSNDSLIELARSLSADKSRIHGFGDPNTLDDHQLLELGSKTAVVTKDSLTKAFEHLPKDSGYILLPYDTSDGLLDLDWSIHPQDDNYFMQTAHIFESRDYRNINLFKGVKNKENQNFFDNFFKTLGNKPKPCISGSDAHKFSDYGKYPSDKITWIKADPTFEGLKQIIYEPKDRVYIGEKPPSLVELGKNPERFIKTLQINEIEENKTDKNLWFQGIDIPINQTGLISIIGNKGSGKSAIADIIALLGNAEKAEGENLSFLHKKRFRNGGLAKRFEATLEFSNGSATPPCCLDDEKDDSLTPKVRYIPQNYFEKITNGELKTFQEALDGVVFGYIPEAERLGKSNFNDLIEYKKSVIDNKIHAVQNGISSKIQELVKLEEQCKQETKDHYKKLLSEAQQNLNILNQQKPEEFKLTDFENDPKIQEEQKQLQELNEELKEIEIEIINTRQKINQKHRQKEELQQFFAKVEGFEREYEILKKEYTKVGSLNEQNKSIADYIGKSFNEIVVFNTDGKSYFQEQIKVLDDEINEQKLFLGEESDLELLEPVNNSETKSLLSKKYDQEQQIKKLKEKLAEPSKKYHDYLEKNKQWEAKRREIEGSIENKTGLKYYESAVAYLDNKVQNKRDEKLTEIYHKIDEIYKLKTEELNLYELFKVPIDNEISKKQLSEVKISIEAKIKLSDEFEDKFLSYIHKGIRGNYNGLQEADKKVSSILEKADYSDFEGVKALIQEFITSFRYDGEGKSLEILNQIKDGKLGEFYNFLFSLDFLKIDYQLKLDDKNLDELSPGEKGSLLLIFYLVLDKEKIPLIIDQPEDNLDNKSVYQKLSQFIKQAKKERQIIIVTHNPNLAIGADAEQIIYVEIDKNNGKNKFSYMSGSIEEPIINNKIVEILEGTKPAFNGRRLRYDF